MNKGVLDILVSDNGPQFISEVFAVFFCGNGIKHLKLMPHHPATNSQAKSFVKALKHALHWGQAVRSVQSRIDVFLHAYRNSVHSTTQEIPAFRMHG